MLARIKPYDGKRFVIRSYTVFGIKFIADRGWYKVDDDVAAYLKQITQRPTDPDSAPAFDVCTAAEALAIDEREKVRANRREVAQAEEARPAMRVHNVARPGAAEAARAATASQAASGDLTTADLRHASPISHLEEILGKDEGPVDAAPDLSGNFDDDMADDDIAVVPSPARSTPPPPKKSHHKGGHHGKKPTELL